MALVPIDESNQVGIYNNNNKVGTISNPFVQSFTPRTECPIDPKNDLMPPGFTSPLNDMKFGPPEQTAKRYFSLTVDDIDSFHKEKIKKWIKVYEKVLGHCFRKVREHVLRDQKFCFFPVPEYLPGFPLYNITHCTFFIIKKLNQAKFMTNYIPPNVIYIYWNVKSHNERVMRPNNMIQNNSGQNQRRIPEEKDIHYVTYQPDDQVPNNQYYSTNTSNINQYGFQQEDQFLFG